MVCVRPALGVDNLSGMKISEMKFLARNPRFQVSANPVRIGCTEKTEMGFKCTECGYEFPHHADGCPYHPDNLK
jgi:hypothetical protein